MKITEAMKLVAAAKVRRAQEAVVNGRPFAENLIKVRVFELKGTHTPCSPTVWDAGWAGSWGGRQQQQWQQQGLADCTIQQQCSASRCNAKAAAAGSALMQQQCAGRR